MKKKKIERFIDAKQIEMVEKLKNQFIIECNPAIFYRRGFTPTHQKGLVNGQAGPSPRTWGKLA